MRSRKLLSASAACAGVALVFPLAIYGQDWSEESPLPKVSSTSACVGGVPNNMATLSTGRTYIAYKETSGSSTTFKITYTDDHGATWGGPLTFNPRPGVPVSGLPSLVADSSDQLHCSWSSGTGLHYARLNTSTNTFTDYQNVATAASSVAFNQITCDRSGALHLIWHVGNAESTTSTAEVWYARRASGATSFGSPVQLSDNDGVHSAFPSLDATGADGSLIAVAWRDAAGAPYTPGMDWNIIVRVSPDGGVTWNSTQVLASGTDRQFDPMVIVDRHNRIHIAHHAYPGAPLDPSANYIAVGYSDDGGATWKNASGSSGLGRVSPEGENHSLCKAAYDYAHDIVWFFWKWKDASAEDILAMPVYRGGQELGPIENITSLNGTASAAFHNFSVGPDGRVRAHYHRSEVTPLSPFNRATIFFRERDLPPPLTPSLGYSLDTSGATAAMVLEWPCESEVSYEIQTSEDLAAWDVYGDPLTGTLGNATSSVPIPSGADKFFVRIRASR